MKLTDEEMQLVIDAVMILDDFVVEQINQETRASVVFDRSYLERVRAFRARLRDRMYKELEEKS